MAVISSSPDEYQRLRLACASAFAERDWAVRSLQAVAGECYRLAEMLPQLGAATTTSVATRDFDGFRVCGWADDAVVSAQILSGVYEPDVTSVFRGYVRPGMYVLDIGANVGYFTMLAASLVGASGLVDAIEANPRNAKLLEVNRRLNGFQQVRIANVAVGAEMGLLSLTTDYSNGSTPSLAEDVLAPIEATTIPCFRLGQIVQPMRKIDAIKIDIEGAEYQALLPAQTMLRRDRPTIVSEFAPGALKNISGVTEARYLEFLIGCGFVLGVILPTGDVDWCGTDCGQVIRACVAAGGDHIDILAAASGAADGNAPLYATEPEFYIRVRSARAAATQMKLVEGTLEYFQYLKYKSYDRGPIATKNIP